MLLSVIMASSKKHNTYKDYSVSFCKSTEVRMSHF